jgi:putative transposase
MRATKRYGHPQVIVTDRLRSYQVAMPDIGIETRKETGRWFNNRAENSRQSLRRRKRTVTNFRSARALLKFATGYASVHDHFNLTLSLGELNGTMVESNQVVAMSFRERLT